MINYEIFDGLNLSQLLEKAASDHPDKVALVFNDRRITFSDFNDKVDRLAAHFQRAGVKKGDVCAVLLPNSIESIFVQYAILRVGGVFSTLSTRFKKYEIYSMLKHSGARMLVFINEYKGVNFVDVIREISVDLKALEFLVLKGGGGDPESYDLDEMLADSPDSFQLSPLQMLDTELASVMYTSGSTGQPKGVMATHRNHVWNAVGVNNRLRNSDTDTFLVMLPLSHNFACMVLLSNAIMSASKIVVMEVFDPAEALRLIQDEGCSVLYGVPTMFHMMLNVPEFANYNLSTLRTGYMSGAVCPIELVRRVIEEMGCKVSAGYGMTECGCICITEFSDDMLVKSETVGRPIRDERVNIFDDKRNEVSPGVVGEIAVRGENVFVGYFNEPEMTKNAFDSEGWFYTGDLGYQDKSGRYRLAGRKKDMIIRGGFNVYPAEVEELIEQIKGVKQVAVVGVPDEKMGERICACILPLQGYRLSSEEIIKFCRERLSNYKVPDFVEILDSFPTTSAEKIQKFKLKEIMTQKYSKRG